MASAFGCVVLLAAGCGVPGASEPERLGNAPGVGGPAAPTDDVELPAPARDISPVDLVKRYLQSGAAADYDPAVRKDKRIETAVDWARRFLSPIGIEKWRSPGTTVTVVDATDFVTGIDTVTVTLRKVGVLNEDGVLVPDVSGEPANYTFGIASPGTSGPLLLSQVPENLLPLSLDGLRTIFEVRPVYYWDLSNRFLVPDRRYLSRGISSEKRVKTIVERVLAGPSQFLSAPTRIVSEPPVEKPLDNTVLNGNNVVVNLPVFGQADLDEPLRRLATQLRWSLHPDLYTVELQVGGREGRNYSGSEYLRANPFLPPDGGIGQRLFGAVDGRLVPIEPGAMRPSILEDAGNSNVIAGTVNVTQNSAALVRDVGGKRELWVGRTPAGQATTGNAASAFRKSEVPGGVAAFGRPSFLPGTGGRVLVVGGGGGLYDVDLNSTQAIPVPLPPLDGPPVAVSVAPDGARIAIVTTTRAYVATIDTSKLPVAISNSPQQIRELYVRNLADLRGVAWYSEHQLIVGGRSGLMVAAIDGGALEATGPPDKLQSTQLTQLSAAPVDPMPREPRPNANMVIEVSVSGTLQAYYPNSGGLVPINPPPVPGAASPAPSASGSPGVTPPQTQRVTAAFYADVT